jgi:hypothetical protein
MATRALVIGFLSVLLVASAPVSAQNESAQHLAKPVSRLGPCIPGPHCPAYKHLVSVPANALSYAPASAFALQARGVGWLAGTGTMTLTLHRPADFPAGGKIRVTVFHQVTNDASGTLQFTVEPTAFSSGNSFETYGSQGTNTVAAPENPTIVLQQSVVISPGNGWNPDRDWWYLELHRQGTYTGSLRVMSVAIEY